MVWHKSSRQDKLDGGRGSWAEWVAKIEAHFMLTNIARKIPELDDDTKIEVNLQGRGKMVISETVLI